MRRTTGWALAGLSALGFLSTPSLAAVWTPVGDSAFTTNAGFDWQDHKRFAMAAMVVDNSGNLFSAVQIGTGIPSAGGRLTIFQKSGTSYPGSGRIDVDLNAGTVLLGGSSVTGITAVPGPIIKLVVAGDGNVYGEQGWFQPNYTPNDSSGNIARILKISLTGNPAAPVSITEIWNAGTPFGEAQRISGMTVGGDGNVYWTNAMYGSGENDKFHVLRRYTATAGTPTVEQSPQNGTVLNGFGPGKRFFNLEYVGTKNLIDSFAVVGGGSTDGDWPIDAMGWNLINATDWYHRRGSAYPDNTVRNPGGRDRLMQTAYDQANKRLWLAGRGVTAGSGDQPWEINNGGDSLVNLGGGNFGMKSTKAAASSNRPSWWRRQHGNAPYNNFLSGNGGSLTLGTRFRVESMDAGYTCYLMHVIANTTAAGSDTPVIGLTVRGGVFKLWDVIGNVQIGPDLGSMTPNAWEEFSIYVDGVSDAVKCWHNGSLAYTGAAANKLATSTGEAAFGSATAQSPAEATAAVVTFDWVGVGPGEIAQPGNAWPSGPLNVSGNYAGAYLPGNGLPQNFMVTNTMTRYSGLGTETSLYDAVGVGGNPDPMTGIQTLTHFAANGNDPFFSNKSNGGHYWVTTLAINPCDGTCWIAYGGKFLGTDTGGFYQSTGATDHIGRAYAINGTGDTSWATDQGAPGTSDASTIVALAFAPNREGVFATIIDHTTGQYSVYQAPNPGACCNDPAADVDPGTLGSGGQFGDSDVDMNDVGVFQRCYKSGSLTGACACLDYNHNGQVDDSDFATFKKCMEIDPLIPGAAGGTKSRDNVPAVPGCDQ